MEKKILLPELADMLAQKAGITKKAADNFVRTFFTTIEENLLTDRYVKIKDFGTFKVVAVGERESVNVATGERIQIGSHSKVNFTAEGTLRDIVNQPFAHFSSVELADDAPAEQIEAISVEEPTVPAEMPEAPEEETATTEASAPEPQVEELSEAPVIPVAPAPVAPQTEPAPRPTEPETKEEPREETTPTIIIQQEERPTNWWKVCCLGIIVVLLMIASYYVGYYRLLCPCNETGIPVAEAQNIETDTTDAIADTLPVLVPDTTATRKPVTSPATKNIPQMPGGQYEITGTIEEHTLREGESLRSLAVKHYRNARLADYIVFYNNIPNPDVIPLGATIKIPELRKIENQ